MIGFTFRGIHSSAYNIGAHAIDRSAIPAMRSNEITIPGKHGTIDYGDNTYETMSIPVEIGLVKNSTYAELRALVRELAGWLSGKGQLIFDDEPNLAYDAIVYDYASISQFVGLPAGVIDITFECQPFAEDVDYKQSVTSVAASPTNISITSAGTQDAPCLIYIKNTGSTNITAINLTRKAAK